MGARPDVEFTALAGGEPAQGAASAGAPVTGIDALQRLLDGSRIGTLIALRVIRRGRLLHFTLTLADAR